MNLDELLYTMGMGKYQVIVYIILSLNYLAVNNNHLCMAFYKLVLPHLCKVPANVTSLITGAVVANVTSNECSLDISYVRESGESNFSMVDCPDGWTYDQGSPGPFGWYEWTISSEWDLVCSRWRESLPNLSTTIYFVGVMFGGLLFGTLADMFGRKPVLLTCLYSQIVIGVIIPFSKSYTMFVLLRFVLGFILQGLQSTVFILIMETFPIKYRTYVGVIIECFWALGNMWLALLAFMFRDWRKIQLAISLPHLLTIFYCWLIPESLRWLIVNKKLEKAKQLLKRGAKFNKSKLPDDILDCVEAVAKETEERQAGWKRHTLLDMFRTTKIRIRSFSMFYIWFATSLVYYGLVLDTAKLSGDKYLNYFILACVEMASYIISLFIILRFGRVRPLQTYFFVAGVSCILSVTFPKSIGNIDTTLVRAFFAYLGRSGVSCCWTVNFMYTAEIFPTVIRTAALGACAFWARLGGVLAPQFALLDSGTGVEGSTSIAFGCVALVASFVGLVLPETHRKRLPDTVEQAEMLGRKEYDEVYGSTQAEMQHLESTPNKRNSAQT